ncbi:unnamed protein product [Boreogadus saida]
MKQHEPLFSSDNTERPCCETEWSTAVITGLRPPLRRLHHSPSDAQCHSPAPPVILLSVPWTTVGPGGSEYHGHV